MLHLRSLYLHVLECLESTALIIALDLTGVCHITEVVRFTKSTIHSQSSHSSGCTVQIPAACWFVVVFLRFSNLWSTWTCCSDLWDKATKIDGYMWIWIANKFAKFHAKRLDQSENITKSFRGLLFLKHPICLYHLVLFLRYSTSNNGMTLKSWFRVVQGHWKWHHLINHIWQTIRLSCNYNSILYCFQVIWHWNLGYRKVIGNGTIQNLGRVYCCVP